MKSILLIFFFFIFVNISYANEWVLVSDNQNAVVHQIVDITSIREVSNNVFYLHKQLQEENDDHYANVLVTVDFNKNIEAWDSIALCNKNRLGVVDFLDRTSFLLDEDELNKIFYVYLKSKSDFNRKVEKINL
ncbi:MAG: hypothetical protein IKJ72_00705, partial [Mycoplasmataceae bacterium]|nr:hypothetical protein [Mycoplasmataceae bacterium]